MFPFLEADASVAYAPRGHVTGPYRDTKSAVIGSLDMSNSQMSALIGLNFKF
jgi:hypothetical protein